MEEMWRVEKAGGLVQCHPMAGQAWKSSTAMAITCEEWSFVRKYKEVNSLVSAVNYA